MKRRTLSVLIGLGTFAGAVAQIPPGERQGPPPLPGGDWNHDDRRGPPPPRRPMGGPPGRWWHDPQLVQNLGLTPDQQKRIDDVYQQNRVRLIDLSATVQREQALLEPILGADHPDESRAVAQIDRVAQARADLEKASARMLLSFRGVLSQDQWRRLQSFDSRPPGGDNRR